MENILQIIESYSAGTAHKSGITIITIARMAGISISSLRPLLEELKIQGKIISREGISNTLFFSNQNQEQ